jgi:predicted DNA-binding antitoxin AbrB/MazE fold protein
MIKATITPQYRNAKMSYQYQGERFMSINVEAIYEAGILKALNPLPPLPDGSRVRLTIELEPDSASLRFPDELLKRIDQRREAVFHRRGTLSDSNDLISEGRERELE